jgi:hypothetical protein
VHIFCGCAGHLDEFYFRHNRIEMRRFNYARNSYRDEFSDFSPHSYSHAPPRISSHVLPHFSHGPNHHTYGFSSRENNFVPTRFDYGPRPHHSDRFLCRPSFPAGGSCIHPEPRHLDDSHFSRHGSRPTGTNGEV